MTRKTLAIIGLITLAIGTLSCCAMLNAPKKVVNEHLKAWADKDYETGYALHAPTMNKTLPPEEFKYHVDNIRIKSFKATSINVSGTSAKVKGTVVLENEEKWGFRYTLIQRGDEWRIIGYDISPGALFEEED
ncbi:hypothetical protein GF338_11325 [candidate division WOR-3 bacterium]|nr:hypothetical protein [candidate division WOR-3 bacterium]